MKKNLKVNVIFASGPGMINNPDGSGKIDPDLIPDYVFDEASRILKTSVRRFFEKPGVKEDCERWFAEYEKEQREKARQYAAEGRPLPKYLEKYLY